VSGFAALVGFCVCYSLPPSFEVHAPPCILQSYITISLVSYSSQLAASALFLMSSLNPETLPTICY
jgi:hypothetical protein